MAQLTSAYTIRRYRPGDEGAVLKLEELDRDHLTFRNADDGRVNVLMRRRDGNLELIETG